MAKRTSFTQKSTETLAAFRSRIVRNFMNAQRRVETHEKALDTTEDYGQAMLRLQAAMQERGEYARALARVTSRVESTRATSKH